MKKILFITVIMATLALSGCLRHFPPTDATNVFPIYLGTGIDLCEQ